MERQERMGVGAGLSIALLDESHPPKPLIETDVDSAATEQHARDPWVRCAACGNGLTACSSALRILDAHRHRFTNPGGYIFDIRCFREAEGCVAVGEPSSFWSWFPGYSWQIAHCRACAEHLGWQFLREDSGFIGLIIEKIRIEDVEQAN